MQVLKAISRMEPSMERKVGELEWREKGRVWCKIYLLGQGEIQQGIEYCLRSLVSLSTHITAEANRSQVDTYKGVN